MRKLGLLWLLIRNGTLLDGSVLFWDEPETNLNPKQFGALVEILLELHRLGVPGIPGDPHDYVILKELDLRRRKRDQILFHALYRDKTGKIDCRSTSAFLDIHPNAIAETFTDLYRPRGQAQSQEYDPVTPPPT